MSTKSTRHDAPGPPAVHFLVCVVLRGLGQVMFQGHAGTGLFFLLGIALASPLMAAGALLGAVLGPLVAWSLGYPPKEVADGLDGFNPVLVGIGLLFYLDPVPLTWGLLVCGCALSVVVARLSRLYLPFPVYTAPFIFVTWCVLLVVHGYTGTRIDHHPAAPQHTPHGFVEAVLAGAAEVMFGANVYTGLLFLLGVASSNVRHALMLLFGSVVGTSVAYYHHDPATATSIGIYGYNSALAALAVYLWRRSLIAPTLAAVLAVPLTEFFPNSLGLPALTAPFVGATWLILALGRAEAAAAGVNRIDSAPPGAGKTPSELSGQDRTSSDAIPPRDRRSDSGV